MSTTAASISEHMFVIEHTTEHIAVQYYKFRTSVFYAQVNFVASFRKRCFGFHMKMYGAQTKMDCV